MAVDKREQEAIANYCAIMEQKLKDKDAEIKKLKIALASLNEGEVLVMDEYVRQRSAQLRISLLRVELEKLKDHTEKIDALAKILENGLK